MVRVVLVLAALVAVSTALPKRVVYRRRAACGNNHLSYEGAEAACELEGGRLATKDELNKFISKFDLRECGPGACGWLRGRRNFEAPCEESVTKSTKCTPGEEGADAWCFGKPPNEEQPDKDECPKETVVIDHTLSLDEYAAYEGRDCSKEYSSWQRKDVIKSGVTVDECLGLCNDNPECEAFTFNNGDCETFTFVCPKLSQVADTKPDVTMYIKPRHNTGHKNLYNPYLGKACYPPAVTRDGETVVTGEERNGPNGAGEGIEKEYDCAEKCAKITDCTGFNFESREDTSLTEEMKEYWGGNAEAAREYYSHFEAPRGFCTMRNGTAANCERIEEKIRFNYYEKIIL